MRYRTAHWWLAALLPLTILAFWPGYFSQMRGAPLAHHVHGAAGMLWLALATVQSWSIATRRFALHRQTGRLVLVVVPLFAAGGALAIVALGDSFVAGTNPFNREFGSRLLPLDLTAAIAVPLLVRDALVHRRTTGRHAAAMLAAVILILPPMFGRLFQHIPGAPPGFEAGFYAGQIGGAAIALLLWWRDRRDGAPFLAVAGIALAHCIGFAFVDFDSFARTAALLSPLPTALVAALAAFALLWSAWRPAPALARRAPAG